MPTRAGRSWTPPGPRGARRAAAAAILCFGAVGAALVQQADEHAPAPAPPEGVRFTWIDVFVDSGAMPLAAYQVEVRATKAGTADEAPAQGGDEPPRSGVSGDENAVDTESGAAPSSTERATNPASPTLVGVEGGEPAAYAEAPYYDPAALHEGAGERIVLAAFSTKGAGELPSGKVRVARLHVRVSGGAVNAGYEARLVTAADADGKAIEAGASLSEGDSR